MLLIVEKELEAKYFMQYIGMLKQIINIKKIVIKNIESSYLMQITCMDGQCLKDFEWMEQLSEFDERFIKIMMKIMIKEIFLMQTLNIRKI